MNAIPLGELKKGQIGRILEVEFIEGDELSQRLLEIGVLEGSLVELVHEAPFGGEAIAIRVRGAMIALRRSEAARVQVRLEVPIHE